MQVERWGVGIWVGFLLLFELYIYFMYTLLYVYFVKNIFRLY